MYNYNYGDYSNYASSANTFLGMAVGLAIFVIIVAIAVAVLLIIAYWKVFKKAGKKGWEAIIPYYNSWTLNEISGAHWIWWIVLTLAGAGIGQGINITLDGIDGGSVLSLGSPIASICRAAIVIATLVVSINVAKKFGKSTVFGVFLLGLLPFIGYPILAFGSAKYDDKLETAPHGIFDREWNKAHAKEVKKASNNCPSCNEKITAKMNNCPNCGTKLK